jgi:hypothetical protein
MRQIHLATMEAHDLASDLGRLPTAATATTAAHGTAMNMYETTSSEPFRRLCVPVQRALLQL